MRAYVGGLCWLVLVSEISSLTTRTDSWYQSGLLPPDYQSFFTNTFWCFLLVLCKFRGKERGVYDLYTGSVRMKMWLGKVLCCNYPLVRATNLANDWGGVEF